VETLNLATGAKMSLDPTLKLLMKILIGTAWIDGTIQPEERTYLNRVAQEKGIANEPELQPLLYEFRAVKPEECYAWVKEYLGDRPTSEACQHLLEAISGLIYSDGTVAMAEAKLLNELQALDPNQAGGDTSNAIVKMIRKLYQRGLSKLE
jgi:uncharacterized tellurite resistance protein B-like protein